MSRALVATDFSTRSDRALRRAVLLAARGEAALTLVHVVDDDQPAHLVETRRTRARELLENTARSIRSVEKLRANTIVTTGDPFAGILRVADDIDPDLIVVGPHRRQLLDMFVGTTAERVIRRSRHPVLMTNSIPAAPYERALLAIDFDDASAAAAQTARKIKFLDELAVTAVHLFDAPAAGLMKRAMEGSDAVAHYVREEKISARAEFDSFVSAMSLTGAERLVRPHAGSVATGLLSQAEALRADLIVVGTNQRRGLKKAFLGSVAQDVLRDAKCDILIVPPASDTKRLAA